MEENDKVYKLCKRTIKKWVGDNYGTQEMEDPSWNIDSLSRSVTSAILRKIYGEEMEHKKLTLLVRAGCNVRKEFKETECKIKECGGKIIMKADNGIEELPFGIGNEFRVQCYHFEIRIPQEKVSTLAQWLNDRDDVIRYLIVNEGERW